MMSITDQLTRAVLVSATALAVVGASPGVARAQQKYAVVEYDRNANSLLAELPQGTAFKLQGTILDHERRVEVFYREQRGKNCSQRPPRTIKCPRPEKSGGWACQGWTRTVLKTGQDKNLFEVLIPRLRHSMATYCVQVVFYRGITAGARAQLVDGLLSSMARVRELRHRTGRQVAHTDVVEVVDEFIKARQLWQLLPPGANNLALRRQIKKTLVSHLGLATMVATKIPRTRSKLRRAFRKLVALKGKHLKPAVLHLGKTVKGATETLKDPAAKVRQAELTKVLEVKILKGTQTRLGALRWVIATIDDADSLGDIEKKLSVDEGQSFKAYLRAVRQLCKAIRRLKQVTPTTPVDLCPASLDKLVDGAARVHKVWTRLQKANAALTQVTADIGNRVAQFLTDRVFQGATRPEPAPLSGKRLAEYYFTTDVGLAAAFLPRVQGTEVVPLPYVGLHFYLQPVNSEIPLRLEDSFLRRFSLFVGVNLSSFKVNKIDLSAHGLLGPVVILLGAGLRINDMVRLNAGALLYRIRRQNPLFQDQPGRVGVTGFVSLSLDLHVYKFVKNSLSQAKGL